MRCGRDRLRLLKRKKTSAMSAMARIPAPIPMPAFAPVDSDEEACELELVPSLVFPANEDAGGVV